jgi:prepilin-type N-terminal cleavage/methylation domain-containing protein
VSRRVSTHPALRPQAGMTLIEVVTVLAIAGIVTSSLYILLGAGIKGYLIARARVSDQEQGRHVLNWIADRVRQVDYAPHAPCPDGVLLAGNGDGFPERLAFRAVLDENLASPRRTTVYYLERRTLWQETLIQETTGACLAEAGRAGPDPNRVALTAPVVQAFDLAYLDRNGNSTSSADLVRSLRITVTVETTSLSGRVESQTYQTLATLRGP